MSPNTSNDTTTVAMAIQSRLRRRTPSMRTPNTAVTTRFALMIVCERNNGIRRAETMLPRKPTISSTIPAMNVGVRAAWIVERSVGAPVAVTSVRCPWPAATTSELRAL